MCYSWARDDEKKDMKNSNVALITVLYIFTINTILGVYSLAACRLNRRKKNEYVWGEHTLNHIKTSFISINPSFASSRRLLNIYDDYRIDGCARTMIGIVWKSWRIAKDYANFSIRQFIRLLFFFFFCKQYKNR